MKTGFRGAFVISWSQTEVDGLVSAPVQALSVGAAWSWRGDLVRVLPDWELPVPEIFAVTASRLGMDAKVTAFLDYLRATLRP